MIYMWETWEARFPHIIYNPTSGMA